MLFGGKPVGDFEALLRSAGAARGALLLGAWISDGEKSPDALLDPVDRRDRGRQPPRWHYRGGGM